MRRSHGLILVAALVLLVALIFPAHAQPTSKPTIKKIILPALPPGTSWYSMMIALSQLINKNTDMVSVVEPVTSPAAFHELLKAEEAHIMIEQATETWHAYRGEYGGSWIFPVPKYAYKGHRLLMGLNNNYYGFITGAFTGITTIPGLKGKKISMKYPTLPCGFYAREQLRAYGLDPDKDVRILEYPFTTRGLMDLQEKRIDAVNTSMGGAKIIELDAKIGAVWLPFDPGKIGVVQKLEPQIQSGMAPTYIPGVKVSIPAIYIRNFLIAESTVPDVVAYNAVKVISERSKDVAGLTWELREWTKERAIIPNTFFPYHPGAIKYFKEQGMWTNALESLQKKLLAELPKQPK